MINLDDINAIKKLDKSNMLSSIMAIPDQCQQAWKETKVLDFPADYSQVKNIVVSGMGGSALGAQIIKSLFSREMLIPLEIVNDYHLPVYVDENTLVILSSYSGSTEETLATAYEALEKKAKITGITTGGKLGEFLKQHDLPRYIFDPKFNPCGQPRMGLGYSIIGQIGLLARLGILKIEENEFFQCLEFLKVNKSKLERETKETVKKCLNKEILVVGAEHLSGNTHILANQINENSKTISFYFLLPELNHYLMEGLKNPSLKNLIFLFLVSNLYNGKIKIRLSLTEEVISKNNISFLEFKPKGETRLIQVLETLLFGSYFSFYLSIAHSQDPTPIPWVDYFKEKLAAHER